MASPDEDYSNLLPLREPTFFILLSLATEAKHGYAILKDVERLSQGKVRLSTGTLYEGLARLLEQGLVERVPDEQASGGAQVGKAAHPGRPRKAYRLTHTGLRLLQAETNRMQTLVAAAQRRLRGEPA